MLKDRWSKVFVSEGDNQVTVLSKLFHQEILTLSEVELRWLVKRGQCSGKFLIS